MAQIMHDASKSTHIKPQFSNTSHTQIHRVFVYKAGFYVEHGDTSNDEESIDRLWLVVRSLKDANGKFDYKIKKFDTIKLGRVRFRVKDFRCEQMNLTAAELF
jgi:hypothetical protein